MATPSHTYRLVHDRPNQRLRVLKLSSGRRTRVVTADIPLAAPIELKRIDGGFPEGEQGFRTVSLRWGPNPDQAVSLTANTSLQATLEDEATLLTLPDGSAYDFGANASAGDELESILREVVNGTGFYPVADVVLPFTDAAVKTLAADLLDTLAGSAYVLPTGVVGATVRLQEGNASDYVRYTESGTVPAEGANAVGRIIGELEVVEVGKTPNSPKAYVHGVQDARFIRSAAWSGTAYLAVTLWGLR